MVSVDVKQHFNMIYFISTHKHVVENESELHVAGNEWAAQVLFDAHGYTV